MLQDWLNQEVPKLIGSLLVETNVEGKPVCERISNLATVMAILAEKISSTDPSEFEDFETTISSLSLVLVCGDLKTFGPLAERLVELAGEDEQKLFRICCTVACRDSGNVERPTDVEARITFVTILKSTLQSKVIAALSNKLSSVGLSFF